MFRRSLTLPADCREAQLRITAAFHYILYVNGTLVTRGPARSYDFRKAYDTVDVQPYLRPGNENVLAILAPRHKHLACGLFDKDVLGILAELSWTDAHGNQSRLGTDRHWKVRRHDGFPASAAGFSICIDLLLWREERFDARRQAEGWNAPGFTDSDWDTAVELGPVGIAPWTTKQGCFDFAQHAEQSRSISPAILEPSGIGLLSDDPVAPQAVTAIELARLRPGYRFRFVAPAENINDIKLYATEVACAVPATVCIASGTGVSLDGQAVDGDTLHLTPGRHLLCLCQRGYYSPELELLLTTEAELAFSAAGVLAEGEARRVYRSDAGEGHPAPTL